MNWPIEHHMYAGVPCYKLKALAVEIKDDMPPPRTFLGAWTEMRAIWRRQKTEPHYAFDTPFPASGEQPATSNASELIASLGDLATKGSELS